ncbi:sensor histidine kinase [Conyzicola nivalis]|uniref:Oxygen sensor histidine kinase NreB n=1 Tax=Conyzicola nivalis TaxID=1477021 RepID=A0A916WK40_9MICO|nr:sensor histidine kinase [Conyzicola nivalis]GGB05589.1 two-component sensor histidine kinase [Conyzicola nivalis]
MGNIRGWDIAVVSAAAILFALVLANGAEGGELVGAGAVIVAIIVVWFALGRGSEDGSPRAITVSALIVVLSGVGTAISPSMATAQAIAFPLLWLLAGSTRAAVVANVSLAVSVGTGYFLYLGGTWSALSQAVVIEAISLAGSFAIGFWITRISEESAERARLIDELRETQAQLEAVSRDAGAMGERERLAREIHDTIAQDLTGLVLLAQRTRRELVSGSPTVGETVDLLEDSARTALAETRSLVAASAPVALAEGGIRAALDRLASRFGRETGIVVGVVGETPPLDRDTEVVLLRCAQEGLANVRKHSAASNATLELTVDETSVTLIVRDDGDGFDPALENDGFGLSGMRDRLTLVGGTLAIASSPGVGTSLTATLPRSAVLA